MSDIDASSATTTYQAGTAEPFTDAQRVGAINVATELLARRDDLTAAVTAEDPQTAVAVVDEAINAAAEP